MSRKPGRFAVLAVTLLVVACGAETNVPPDEPLVSPTGDVDWSVYHTSDQANQILREFEELHPNLIELRTIGQSYLGADLVLAEVTNERTGPADEKPAIYIDGGIHASELTGSQVALYYLAHLVDNHGRDAEITELLDTRTFYIRPKFNPDGSDLVLAEDQSLRSTVRPVDDNADGIADNDPPEDLNGDGRILSMRVRDADGGWTVDPDDPRIMRRRAEGDAGPFYRVLREGVDRNGDGVINSDGIGGIDMNRNFPRNWGRWHVQPGAGAFPLSEPETYATVRFIDEHRNISLILHGHTSGGFVYRLPSAMDPAAFDANDEALVVRLGELYTESTGRPIRPSATHAVERRYGTLIQWGYSDHGIIGYVPEYSPPPEEWVPDYDGDGEVDERDWHRYDEEEFDGRYFSDWEPYDHPQLGEVEIGGWWRLFWGRNPPHALLERELETQVAWLTELAARTPLVQLERPRVRAVGDDRFRVAVTVTNTGYLPTNVTERGLVGDRGADGRVAFQVARAPLVVLEVEGGDVVGYTRKRIGHLAGSSPFSAGVTERSRSVEFEVRRTAPDATVRFTVYGEKAGTVRSERVGLGAATTE